MEQGFVLLPRGLRLLASGDPEAAHEAFAGAGRIGERFGSPDLVALSRLGRGQALAAEADLAHIAPGTRPEPIGDAHRLTPRELEVLRLVASGAMNRAIGEALFISERRVPSSYG